MLTTQAPKDLATNLLWRAFIRIACERRKRHREAVLDRCKYDVDFFFDSFLWQYNPARIGDEVGPFILRERQSQILEATSARMFPARPTNLRLDTIWEKSREEGASWMALGLFVHRCLFWKRQKFLCVSHSKDAVDKTNDPDSLFWKIDHIHEHLPEWMNPPTGNERVQFSFWYPATKSSITGQAQTVKAGVGGRATGILLDELGKMQFADRILADTADTGPRLMVSTHYGVSTPFYKQTIRPDVHKELLHWTHNPDKAAGLYRWDDDRQVIEVLDKQYVYPPEFEFIRSTKPDGGPFRGLRSPWYDAECHRRQSDRDVAMHLDINPEGSGYQFFDASTIFALIKETAREPSWRGDIVIAHDMTAKLVERAAGHLSVWIPRRAAGRWIRPGRYGMGGDIAAGTGATPSCASIADADLGHKIAQFQDANLSPEVFASYCYVLGHLFCDEEENPAFFAYENAGGLGEAFGKAIMALGYSNLYRKELELKMHGYRDETEKPGWYPTPTARRLLMETYRTKLGLREFINPSKEALEDCLKFVHTQSGDVIHSGATATDDPTAGRFNHGDLTVGDALCCMCCEKLGGRAEVQQREKPPVEGSWQWRFERGQRLDREREEVWQ